MIYTIQKSKQINSEALRLQFLEAGITTFINEENSITLIIEPYQQNDVDRIFHLHQISGVAMIEPNGKMFNIMADGIDSCRFVVSGNGDFKTIYINGEPVQIELQNEIGSFELSSETVGILEVMINDKIIKVAAL